MFISRKYILIAVALCMLMLCLGGRIILTTEESPLEDLLSRLKSKDLKQLVKKKHADLDPQKRDHAKARGAFDLLYDLRATSVMIEGIISYREHSTKAYAASLLKDIVKVGDVSLAKRFVEEFEIEIQSLAEGGTEVAGARKQYQKTLVEIISKITGLDFKGFDPSLDLTGFDALKDPDVAKILRQTKDWIRKSEKSEKK